MKLIKIIIVILLLIIMSQTSYSNEYNIKHQIELLQQQIKLLQLQISSQSKPQIIYKCKNSDFDKIIEYCDKKFPFISQDLIRLKCIKNFNTKLYINR